MGALHYTGSPVQRQQTGGEQAFPSQLMAAPVNNTGLPDNLKTGMENLSGVNLDHVRVLPNQWFTMPCASPYGDIFGCLLSSWLRAIGIEVS